MNSFTDRLAAVQTAQKILSQSPVYLDTETTGIDNRSEIVEICIVDHQGKVLLDSLIKPMGYIPFDATNIHGITDDMVVNEPGWIDLWPEIKSLLTGKNVCIYNADFDLRLIKQTNKIYNLSDQIGLNTQFSCIMKLYAQYYGRWNPRRGSYRWQSLDAARAQLGLSMPNSHRAKDDTLLAREVLLAIANSEPP